MISRYDLLALECGRRVFRAQKRRPIVEGSEGDRTTSYRLDNATHGLRLPVTVLGLNRVVISGLGTGPVAFLGL